MTEAEFVISSSLPLPGSTPQANLDAKNALARTLTPEYMRLRPEDYADITPHMVDLAAPERLQPDLIRAQSTPDPLEVRCEATASPYESRKFVYVGVLPHEYLLMTGRVATAGDRSLGKAMRRRASISQSISETDKEAAGRSGVHTVESIAGQARNYLVNELGQTLHRIHRFQEAAAHKGLARFGNEGKMRTELAMLQQFTFGGMLTVVGNRRGWSEEQRSLARRALEVRFFLLADKRQRVANFAGMLGLAEEWTLHKQAITKGRIADAEKYIRERTVEK